MQDPFLYLYKENIWTNEYSKYGKLKGKSWVPNRCKIQRCDFGNQNRRKERGTGTELL